MCPPNSRLPSRSHGSSGHARDDSLEYDDVTPEALQVMHQRQIPNIDTASTPRTSTTQQVTLHYIHTCVLCSPHSCSSCLLSSVHMSDSLILPPFLSLPLLSSLPPSPAFFPLYLPLSLSLPFLPLSLTHTFSSLSLSNLRMVNWKRKWTICSSDWNRASHK